MNSHPTGADNRRFSDPYPARSIRTRHGHIISDLVETTGSSLCYAVTTIFRLAWYSMPGKASDLNWSALTLRRTILTATEYRIGHTVPVPIDGR